MVDYNVSSYVIICYLYMSYLQLMMFRSNDEITIYVKLKLKKVYTVTPLFQHKEVMIRPKQWKAYHPPINHLSL